MSSIPVYFSHSRRREDRDVNGFFWRIFHDAGFAFTVSPGPAASPATALELMIARSAGFAAVVPFREHDRHKCPPFTLHEYGLAVRARQPRLVLRDNRVPPRYFRAQDTAEIEFDAAAPDRCASELASRLSQFRALASGPHARTRCRRGRAGIAMAAGTPAARARRAVLEGLLDKDGHEVVDLAVLGDDPWQLAQGADDCDFAVVDLDDARACRITDFLLGRGTPLLKVARRDPGRARPGRLPVSAPLRLAAAGDDLVTYWATPGEFESRVRCQLSLAAAGGTQLAGLDAGQRYFRSLGRGMQRVFVSSAGSARGLASELASALRQENIAFFHYQFHNLIGPGQRWAGELGRMVAASRIFLPVIDGSYWASDYCRQEYEAAVRLERQGRLTIVPALLAGHPAGPGIPYQGVELSGMPLADQVTLLTGHLDALLAAEAGPAASRPAGPAAARHSPADAPITTAGGEHREAPRPAWQAGGSAAHHGRPAASRERRTAMAASWQGTRRPGPASPDPGPAGWRASSRRDSAVLPAAACAAARGRPALAACPGGSTRTTAQRPGAAG